MKTSFLIILLAALPCLVSAQVVSDPVQDFKSRWDLTGVTKIYKLQADINHDGRQELLLSTGTSDVPDREFSWEIYVPQTGGGYLIAGQNTSSGVDTSTAASFSKDQYFIGLIPEVQRYGILKLTSGNGGQALCQLHAITIDGNNSFTDTPIGQPVNAETNYDTLAKRFRSPPVPAMQTLTP